MATESKNSPPHKARMAQMSLAATAAELVEQARRLERGSRCTYAAEALREAAELLNLRASQAIGED